MCNVSVNLALVTEVRKLSESKSEYVLMKILYDYNNTCHIQPRADRT